MTTTIFPERPKAKGSSEMAPVENEDIIKRRKRHDFLKSRRHRSQKLSGLWNSRHQRLRYLKSKFISKATRKLTAASEKFSSILCIKATIAIAYNDMKVLEAHELFSAITKGTKYDFDRTVAAILKSAKERNWVDVK